MYQVKRHSEPEYPAEHFINTKPIAMLEVIEQSPLATLLFFDNNNELDISHIPFHFTDNTIVRIQENQSKSKSDSDAELLIGHKLMAHVSNKHPLAQHLKAVANNTDDYADDNESDYKADYQVNAEGKNNITLIFHGEDDYISPNDVSAEHSSSQKVPTWNYAKVHVSGQVTEVTDLDEKYQQMLISSDHFEQIKLQQKLTSPNKQVAWSLASVPSHAIEHMLKAITVFTFTISRIEGRFKLSQNKATALRAQIAEQVTRRNKAILAKHITGT